MRASAPLKSMVRLLVNLHSSQAAREQIGVFLSQLTLNAALFGVLFIASLRLGTSEFAQLSIANNSLMQLANIFSFGLDYSAIKLSIESRSSSFVAINFLVKAAFFGLSLFLFLAWAMLIELRPELLIFAAATSVAFWASSVSVMQYRRQFTRFALLNVTIAATRLVFGIVAVMLKSWTLVILALHVAAQFPIQLVTLVRGIPELRPTILWRDLRPLIALSPLVFASGNLFSFLPLITQGLLYGRGDDLATSAFGVALIFAAPLHTLVGTLQIYLLPQALSRDLQDIDVFGLGRGSMKLLVIAFTGVFLVGTLPAAVLLEWIYGKTIPLASTFFVIYFAATVISSSVGLLNIRSQRGKLVRIALAANVCRAGATAMLFFFPGLGPIGVVASSAAIMVIGEFGLWAVLKQAERTRTLIE